jgi:hypothetical protein
VYVLSLYASQEVRTYTKIVRDIYLAMPVLVLNRYARVKCRIVDDMFVPARTRRWNKEAHERSVHGFWDQNPELSCTSFAELKAATNSFHEANLLGQGGFGKVYKVAQFK